MAEENFDACFSHVLGSEGGYQADPNDKGNWTGCKVGAGTNKGTNWGISACSYPELDIKNLSQDDAKEIYREDYWDQTESDLLPYGIDLATFDGGVNSGCSRGAKWLQQAVGVPADGIVGPVTVEAANICDMHETIDRMCDARLTYLQGLDTWDLYGNGWSTRVKNVRTDAHAMQNANPGAVTEPVPVPIPEPEMASAKSVLTLMLRITAQGPVTLEIADDVTTEP